MLILFENVIIYLKKEIDDVNKMQKNRVTKLIVTHVYLIIFFI